MGTPPIKKGFLSGIAQITSPMCITETIKVDYDNDKSDNCDYNFGTFSDFGVKNDQKVYT